MKGINPNVYQNPVSHPSIPRCQRRMRLAMHRAMWQTSHLSQLTTLRMNRWWYRLSWRLREGGDMWSIRITNQAKTKQNQASNYETFVIIVDGSWLHTDSEKGCPKGPIMLVDGAREQSPKSIIARISRTHFENTIHGSLWVTVGCYFLRPCGHNVTTIINHLRNFSIQPS